MKQISVLCRVTELVDEHKSLAAISTFVINYIKLNKSNVLEPHILRARLEERSMFNFLLIVVTSYLFKFSYKFK